MKKGDLIARKIDIPVGKVLMRGFVSEENARDSFDKAWEYYNLQNKIKLELGGDELNPGYYTIVSGEATFTTQEARVNWVVGNEVAITFMNSGASQILDVLEPEDTGWVVTQEAAPEYQDSVEHMSDEELIKSIEALRGARLATPMVRSKTTDKAPPMSEADKKLNSTLGTLSAEAKLELMRKLGMVE